VEATSHARNTATTRTQSGTSESNGRLFRGWTIITVVLVIAACSARGVDESAPTPLAVTLSEARLVDHDEWGAVFDDAGMVGTIAVREVGSVETHVWNRERAGQPRRPASTFKILNSMIILQTGVLDDVDTVVRWDGIRREVPEWNRDHSLRSGIEVSAVWMFQLLAREVGDTRMADEVARADYGNADIGGGVDQFWLSGDLRISPLEQLDFLERMVGRDLPFDDDVLGAVQDILIREQGDGWSWSHKTGTALIEDPPLGWFVGSTSHLDREWVFAMNIDLPFDGGGLEGQIDPLLRQRITREILESQGALPDAA
jgi:beta-lactamase class D